MTIEEAARVLVKAMGEEWTTIDSLCGYAKDPHFWMSVWTWAKGEEWWDDFWEWLEDKFYKEMEAKGCHRERWGDYFLRKRVTGQYGDGCLIGSPDFLIELAEFLEGEK